MTDYKYGHTTVPGASADDVYYEFERIREDSGLTPQNVVDEARPKTALLHPAFDWVDKVAGENWRKHQARKLIRSIIIEIDDDVTPAYTNVSIMGSDDRLYERTHIVVQSPDLYDVAMHDAVSRLRASMQSVSILQRLASESSKITDVRTIKRAARLIEDAQDAISALQ